jgi:hypothetical protein
VQADAQPFASPVSTQPLIDALSEAGFAIIRSGPFAALNKAKALHSPTLVARYLVIAQKR